MSKFIMMVGLPGSGKSYAAQNFVLAHNARLFSSDIYREKILGDASNQNNNDKVFRALYKDMDAVLKKGENVVYDATNINIKARKTSLDIVNKYPDIHKIAIVMATPIDMCIERDANRPRRVGKEVIYKFLYKFQIPHFFEGFDEIMIEFPEQENSEMLLFKQKKLAEIKNRMLNFSQNNPHHDFTVGEHCSKVASYFDVSDIRYWAAQYHDIGKLFTQKFDEQGVAHYYSHDSVGAYILLYYINVALPFNRVSSAIEWLFYINYHMRAHNDFMGEKARKKYRALFGEERFDKLVFFGECDRKGAKNELKYRD